MCSQGPDCKKLCTVAALILKSEQIRLILPKPGSGKTWIKGWGDVPDSPFSLESENRKAEKVNSLSRLGYLVPRGPESNRHTFWWGIFSLTAYPCGVPIVARFWRENLTACHYENKVLRQCVLPALELLESSQCLGGLRSLCGTSALIEDDLSLVVLLYCLWLHALPRRQLLACREVLVALSLAVRFLSF